MLQSFYDKVRDGFVREVGERLREAMTDDDLLRRVRRVVYEHGGESTLADVTGNTRTTEMATLTSSMIFDRAVLEGGDAQEFRRVIREAGTEFRKQTTQHLFRMLEAVTEETGNVHRGMPLNAESFCRMLEKIDISFNERGDPVLPTIIVGPDLTEKAKQLSEEVAQRPDLQLRIDVILREKWLNHYTIRPK
jgi:hypothetical protein